MTILEDFDNIAADSDAKFAMMAMANSHIHTVAERLLKHINHRSTTQTDFRIRIFRYEWSDNTNRYFIVRERDTMDVAKYIDITIPRKDSLYQIEEIEQIIHKQVADHTKRWNTRGNPVAVVDLHFKYRRVELWSNYWQKHY